MFTYMYVTYMLLMYLCHLLYTYTLFHVVSLQTVFVIDVVPLHCELQ